MATSAGTHFSGTAGRHSSGPARSVGPKSNVLVCEAAGTSGSGVWTIHNWDLVDKREHKTIEGVLTIEGLDWTIRLAPYEWTQVETKRATASVINSVPVTAEVQLYFSNGLDAQSSGGDSVAAAAAAATKAPFVLTSPMSRYETPLSVVSWSAWSRPWADKLEKSVLKTNTLCIEAKIKVSRGELHPVTAPVPIPRQYHTQVLSDLFSLLQTGDSSDLKLVVSSCYCYHVHRLILQTRSPVFAAMFKHNMRETQSGIVQIEDARLAAFHELLLFLYTGACHLFPLARLEQFSSSAAFTASSPVLALSSSTALEGKGRGPEAPPISSKSLDEEESHGGLNRAWFEEAEGKRHEESLPLHMECEFTSDLLLLADRFQIPTLVDFCGRHLLKALNEDTALSLFQLGDKTHCEALRSGALNFLTLDPTRLRRVTESSMFRSLTAPQCAAVLSSALDPGLGKKRQFSTFNLTPGASVVIVEKRARRDISGCATDNKTETIGETKSTNKTDSTQKPLVGSDLTVRDLKDLLRKAGKKLSGSRSQLIARLNGGSES